MELPAEFTSKHYVYRIACIPNGKVYIGRSSQLVKRFDSHKTGLRTGKHANRAMSKDFMEYGEGGFTFEIIETLSSSAENRRLEGDLIRKHAEEGNAYNAALPGIRKPKETNQAVKRGPHASALAFIAFSKSRHGEKWIQPIADETGYSYDQVYGIAYRGRPVGKRLEIIVKKLPKRKPSS
jgi:group I intron endonuclease